jgi:D-alanyl-D-alanine carboxypeptidase
MRAGPSRIPLKAALGLAPALSLAAALTLGGAANANPSLVVDADSGQVLIDNQGTQPWFPASLTKLMTTYVALSAVRDGRLTMDTPLVVSARAARMPASKMGFRPGVEITLDNALKMVMVKSPNDVAVTIAEGVSGSVEAFADEMNAAAVKLGLHESHFVNPNGLHDPRHVSSARDMAMVARALLKEFPQHDDLYGIGALQLGKEIITTHNGLIGRYPGADGMKTGFTCAAGFNVVASATRNGRRLIAVVLGEPSARKRTIDAAALFDEGFAKFGGAGSLESLAAIGGEAPDERDEICSRRNAAAIAAAEEEPPPGETEQAYGLGSFFAAFAGGVQHTELSDAPLHFDPVPIFIGPKPGWTGPVLAARPTEAGNGLAKADGDLPDGAKAYAPASPSLVGGEGPVSAPVVLQGAVKAAAAIKPALARKRMTRLAEAHKLKQTGKPAGAARKKVRRAETK